MYQSPKSEPGDNLGLTIDVEVIHDITKRFVSIKLYLQGILGYNLFACTPAQFT